MKIKFFKKEKTFKKKNFALNPNLFWELAVGCTLAIVLFAFYFGYNFFMQINQDYILPVASTSRQIPTVDKNRIETDINYFTSRENTSTQILNSPASAVDPSL
jgi:hypothetical protein